jgi:hypothetical protein
MRLGCLRAVPGDPDVADEPLVAGAHRGLERAAGAGHLVELVEVSDGVQLEQVDAVGLQPLEGGVDLRPRRVTLALAGLGREEDALADPRHPRPEPQLSLAVARRDVEVVDAASSASVTERSAVSWSTSGQRCGAVDQYGALVAEAAEPAGFHVPPTTPIDRRHSGAARGSRRRPPAGPGRTSSATAC